MQSSTPCPAQHGNEYSLSSTSLSGKCFGIFICTLVPEEGGALETFICILLGVELRQHSLVQQG